MPPEELRLHLGHLSVAALAWGPSEGRPVLGLHGWLDNAATWDRLAPHLQEVRLVSLDLPGHGRSGHRPAGWTHHFVDWVPDVVAAARALGWDRYSLLAHSMGAGIAALVAGAFPERIERAVLVEGLGPLADPPEAAPRRLAAAAEQGPPAGPPVYPDLEAVVQRLRATRDLSEEAARCLAARAVVEVEGGVSFGHDRALHGRSPVRLTEEQVQAFLRRIACPVLVVRAEQGYPFDAQTMARRVACLARGEVLTVPGGHHLHLDHPERLAEPVGRFLRG